MTESSMTRLEMMPPDNQAGLDSWLNQATRCLSKDSAAQVRSEIREHYESAREDAIGGGATAAEADRIAVTALGNAKTANRQYRKVLLTAAEQRLLRQGNWEARAVCARPWLKWLFLVLPVSALTGANEFFLRGESDLAWTLLVGSLVMSLLFVAPFLPIYTPRRARVFRLVKWVLLATLLFVPGAYKWSWLTVSILWPLATIEWSRTTIRRKIPVAEWPKQLYL